MARGPGNQTHSARTRSKSLHEATPRHRVHTGGRSWRMQIDEIERDTVTSEIERD
jgi:hypothetical protein